MKYFKKSISIILCIITIFTCFTFAVSAQDTTSERLPQVYVAGFESRSIYFKDDPSMTMLFPVNFNLLSANLQNIGDYAKESLEDKDLHIVRNTLYSLFYDTLGMTALKGDGITNADDRITTEEKAFCADGEGYYYFTYDSRYSPIDLAEQLHEYIKQVQVHSGSERFELVGASYGTTVVMTYLNEHPEMHQYIDSLVLSVPSYGGFSVIGEIFSGDFYVDHDTLTQYAYVGMDNPDIGLLLSVLNKSGLLKPLLEWLVLPAVKAVALDVSRDVIHDTIGTIPAIWTFVNEDYFYDALKNIYGKNYKDPNHEYAGLISKIVYYHENIQTKLDDIYRTAQESGIKMNIICKYGRPPMPISKNGSFMSDGSVDVKDVTLGATACKYGETLPKKYKQAKYKEYNFVSPDWCIDASTGIDPLHTWYVRGLEHTKRTNGFIDLINYIIYEDPTVFSDERYPQYTYGTDDGGLAPVTGREEKTETTFFQDLKALTKRGFELLSEAIEEKKGE